ncbi:hypothetical protein Tco_1522685 [Tanacetum coccineum]
MSESAKRQEENSNLIKEIRASTDAAIQNQGASVETLEIQIGKMSKEKDPESFTLPCFFNKVCFDNTLVDLGASVSVMPRSTYLNLGLGELAHTKLTVELADRTVKYPKGIAKNVLVGIGKFTFPVDFIILDMPEDIKVPLILERPFLSTAIAKTDVYKRKITLRVGEEMIVFTSVKTASSLIKRVYMLSLRERMELDLEVRIMGETLEGEVLENIDAYRDEGMGDVIFGKPFLRDVGIKTRRFEGMITIYNGNDEDLGSKEISTNIGGEFTNLEILKDTSIMVNGKNAYELKGKFLDDLHKNASSGTHGEDAVEHIEYFLKIVDPIDLPYVNQDKLRVVVFLISLAGDPWR